MYEVYNLSLLNIIRKNGEISIGDLKKEYIPNTPPGVISSQMSSFEPELKKLELGGCISIEDENVKYLNDIPRQKL